MVVLAQQDSNGQADVALQRYVHSNLTRKRREMNRIFSHQGSIKGRKVLNLME